MTYSSVGLERLSDMQQVTGSIPVTSTLNFRFKFCIHDVVVAYCLAMAEV